MLRNNTKGFGEISQFEVRDGVYTKDEGSVSSRVQGLKFSEKSIKNTEVLTDGYSRYENDIRWGEGPIFREESAHLHSGRNGQNGRGNVLSSSESSERIQGTVDESEEIKALGEAIASRREKPTSPVNSGKNGGAVGNSPTAPPFFIYPFPLFLPCGGSRGSEALR